MILGKQLNCNRLGYTPLNNAFAPIKVIHHLKIGIIIMIYKQVSVFFIGILFLHAFSMTAMDRQKSSAFNDAFKIERGASAGAVPTEKCSNANQERLLDLESLIKAFNRDDKEAARAEAWLRMGEMYYLARGVEENYEQALDYFTQAADQNGNKKAQAEALFMLGEMHYSGRGVAQNYRTAHDYFAKAGIRSDSISGQARAWLYLGHMRYRGKGVQLNYAVALDYFRAVADQEEKNSPERRHCSCWARCIIAVEG